MADGDDDFDDLFAEFEKEDAVHSGNISTNLLVAVGVDPEKRNAAFPSNWVPPTASGLDNSSAVNCGKHWENGQVTPSQAIAAAAEEDADAAAASKVTGRAAAEAALWDEGMPSSPEKGIACSPNLLADLNHVTAALGEKGDAVEVADMFERLAAHGHGVAVLTKADFDGLVQQLTATPEGRELVQLLVDRKKARKT